MERMTAGNDVPPLRARASWHMQQAIYELHRLAYAFTRRFGAWGWGMSALLSVGALAGVAAHRQLEEFQRLEFRLAEQARTHRRDEVPARTPALDDGRARLRAFEDFLLPHDDIPVVVQDLLRLAESEGLSIQRGEYRPQVDAAGGFVRYRMSLPVQGAAPSIHRFIQSSLRKQKALALESVQFRRESIEVSQIEARIQWVLLTRLPAGRGSSLAASGVDNGGGR